MNKLDLNKHLHIHEVNEAELHAVLLPFFGQASYPAPNLQKFTLRDTAKSLELRYTKAGRILSATTNLGADEIQKLSDLIVHDLIENQVPKVAQIICFSLERINGAFRYEDEFQILPAGPDFPDVSVILADHPFLLQFRFVASPVPLVNHLRRNPIATRYVQYLNAISRRGVSIGPKSIGFSWCLNTETNPPTTKWTQHGYWAPESFSGEREEFSPIESLPAISRSPLETYYERGFYSSIEDFSLPESVEELLRKIMNLVPEQRSKFDLSCTWLSMVREITPASSSAAYISMIAAIEALLDKKSETCGACGQAKFSIAQKLKEFVKTYVPGMEERTRELNQIYKVRSDLAHGMDLLLSDLGQFGTSSPEDALELRLRHSTYQLARIALVNWLRSA